MAKPKRSKPAIRLFVTTDRANGERLGRIAVKATKEAGAIVSANTMHDRGMPAMLAALDSCKDCRAGTCDGSVHVRRDVKPDKATLGDLVAAADAVGMEVVADVKPAEPPKVVAAGQGDLFTGAPSLIVADAPASPKRGRPAGSRNKPREVTPDSPEYTRLIDVYHLAFAEARGEKPAYTSRDFAAFKALLKSQGFDRACELIGNAFADEFWKKRVTIRKIADDPSLFAGSKKATDPRPSSTQDEPLPDGWA